MLSGTKRGAWRRRSITRGRCSPSGTYLDWGYDGQVQLSLGVVLSRDGLGLELSGG
jgi:hypothetical protein